MTRAAILAAAAYVGSIAAANWATNRYGLEREGWATE